MIDIAGKSARECSRVCAMFDRRTHTVTGASSYKLLRVLDSAGYRGESFKPVATLEHKLTSGVLTSSLLRDPSDQYLCERNTRNCALLLVSSYKLTRLSVYTILWYTTTNRAFFSLLFNLFGLGKVHSRKPPPFGYYMSEWHDAREISRAPSTR